MRVRGALDWVKTKVNKGGERMLVGREVVLSGANSEVLSELQPERRSRVF